MWVKATALGFDGLQRRRPGEKFELHPVTTKDKEGNAITIEPEQRFSKKWMKKCKAPQPEVDPDDLPADHDDLDEKQTLAQAHAGKELDPKTGKAKVKRASDESKI